MRLLFAGTPQAAVPSLQALLDSGHEVIAILTRPDAPAGRGRGLSASPVRRVAAERGIETLTPLTPRDPALLERIRALAPDACAVVAYGGLVPPALLAVPPAGWVNLHFSLLPAWRGAAPVQHAILAGDEVTGATTFLLEEGLDTGPVLGTLTEPIRPGDTAGELLDRLATAGAALLVATMDGLAAGDLVAVPQAPDGVSLAPKLGIDDALVDWRRPAYAVSRQVRACTPAPGAWSWFRETRLNIAGAQPVAEGGDLGPGQILAGKRAVLVGTGSGGVELGTVVPPGRRPMPAADWARGARIAEGEVLR